MAQKPTAQGHSTTTSPTRKSYGDQQEVCGPQIRQVWRGPTPPTQVQKPPEIGLEEEATDGSDREDVATPSQGSVETQEQTRKRTPASPPKVGTSSPAPEEEISVMKNEDIQDELAQMEWEQAADQVEAWAKPRSEKE